MTVRVPATYFTSQQRREALLKWLRHEFGNRGMFNAAEAFIGAKDVFTPLYGPNQIRKCGSDLRQLRREGHVTRVGHGQWRLEE
jgi:hypothetical protein